jgi:hypothetical protein
MKVPDTHGPRFAIEIRAPAVLGNGRNAKVRDQRTLGTLD